MNTFKTRYRGYDKVEVDRFIDDMRRDYEERMSSQMERIDYLKMDVSMKEKEIAKYREKEADINDALVMSIEKAKEMDYTAKIRFTLEGERIKIFRSKWINYCKKHRDNLKLQGNKDKLVAYLDAMDREIANVLERDVHIFKDIKLSDEEEDYISESERASKFNLDDINDPPDLDIICEELRKSEKK